MLGDDLNNRDRAIAEITIFVTGSEAAKVFHARSRAVSSVGRAADS